MPVEKFVSVWRLQWRMARGFIPWPCRKKTVKVQWCYHFSELTIHSFYFYAQYEGKENGTFYKWRRWKISFTRKTWLIKNKEICENRLLTPA